MKSFLFENLLQAEGWKKNVKIIVNDYGFVEKIEENFAETTNEKVIKIAIPGIPNAHSHAFQYAMSGIAENHAFNASSDFWSWRNAMYSLALSIDPDDMLNIATMLYSEMLNNGYTSVAEFHYLHHDKNGNPYDNKIEMSERLMIAANHTGIKLTLIPICYSKGGFNQTHHKDQKRFISKDTEDYLDLFERCKQKVKDYDSNVGIGIHSLRAVDYRMLNEINSYNNNKLPFHLHISEQKKEIEDALKEYGKRPIEWLYDNFSIGKNHHLVHATHLSESETNLIAKSQSNVVICPITEANLADGLFNFNLFQELNGKWCIGSDSHVGLSPLEEIRLLDYGQRLITNKRNTFKSNSTGNSGEIALKEIVLNGNHAMGEQKENYFQLNHSLDFLEIDDENPLITSTNENNLLNTIIYSGDKSIVKNTYTKGLNRTSSNPENKENIKRRFSSTINKLQNR